MNDRAVVRPVPPGGLQFPANPHYIVKPDPIKIVNMSFTRFKAANVTELYQFIRLHGEKLNAAASTGTLSFLLPAAANIVLNVTKIGKHVDSIEDVPLTHFDEYPVDILVHPADEVEVLAPFLGNFKRVGLCNGPLAHQIVDAHFNLLEFVLPGGRKARIKTPVYKFSPRQMDSKPFPIMPPNTDMYLQIRK